MESPCPAVTEANEKTKFCPKSLFDISYFHSHDETAMLMYKTMAKCRLSFA